MSYRENVPTVRHVVEILSLQVVAGSEHLDNEISGGYASDLLSCVMAGAKPGNVWVTLQAHMNVVAVASLLGLSCVVITENARLDEEALARGEEEGVPILQTPMSTFTVVEKLAQLGVHGSD